MRKYVLWISMVFAVGALNAQDLDSLKKYAEDSTITADVDVTEDGVVQIRFGTKSQLEKKKNEKDKKDDDAFEFGIFNGLDFGFNSFMVNGDLNLPPEMGNFEQKLGNSTNVQLRFLHVDFRPDKHVSMNFAVGLDYNDWALENDVTLLPDEQQVSFLQEDVQFSKNKFKAKYLILPFNLTLSTTNKISFTAGFEPQFLLRGRVKQVSEERGKTKVDDNYHLREFRYAWVGRIGYDGFSFFCRYYPQSIFDNGKGPDMQNIAFGVGFGL